METPSPGMAPGSLASHGAGYGVCHVEQIEQERVAREEAPSESRPPRRAIRVCPAFRGDLLAWRCPGARMGTILLPAGGGMLASQSARGASNGGHLKSGNSSRAPTRKPCERRDEELAPSTK